MNDSLKDFIKKNRAAFDDQEPPDGSWAFIREALPEGKSRSLWNSLTVWRVAAALLLGLSLYFFSTRTATPVSKDTVANRADFSDLESFYRNQIAEKARLINDYDAGGESDQFTQDLTKLDAMYQVLSEEMKTHPGAKVKDAMILNLLVRVDLLNQQLKKLEDTRKHKKTANT